MAAKAVVITLMMYFWGRFAFGIDLFEFPAWAAIK